MSLGQYIGNLSDTQLFFGPAFIVMGFISIFIHIAKSRTINDSLNWPTSAGIIMHSYYFHAKSGRSSPGGADICYYFIVDGKKYESSRVSIIDEHPARELLEKFKEGDEVKVYYNPGNPNKSVLMPGGYFNFYINLCFIILPFFIVGIGVFIFG